VRNGNLGGATNKAAHIEKEGHMINEHGKRCITGFHKMGNLSKAALIEKEGHMINKRGKECITGYHEMGNLNKAAHIEKEGHMINEHGKRCITGFHKLGNLSKAALIEKEGHMINEHGKRCITGYHEMGNKGVAAITKIYAANALDERHTHICISALCRRGASVTWEKGYPVFVHRCFDPQLSGLEGQQLRQKKGLKLHMCKKCHRTAQECQKGAGCRATCNTTNRKSCQHLH